MLIGEVKKKQEKKLQPACLCFFSFAFMYIRCSECLTILFILNHRRLIISCYLVPVLLRLRRRWRSRCRRASNQQYSSANSSTSRFLCDPTKVLNNSDLGRCCCRTFGCPAERAQPASWMLPWFQRRQLSHCCRPETFGLTAVQKTTSARRMSSWRVAAWGRCEEHSRISDPRLKEGEKTTRPPQRRRDPLAPATEEGTHRDQSWFTRLFFLKWPMTSP